MPEFGGNRKIKMPLTAAVVVAGDQRIIIDTGYAGYTEIFDLLAGLDFSPPSFDLVINTHVHPDHAGNNLAFSNAHIVVSKMDYEFARDFAHAMQKAVDPMQVFERFYQEYQLKQAQRHALSSQRTVQRFWQDGQIGRPEQLCWIEDNPELPEFIELWPTPGHTPGHYSVEVTGASRSMLIAGDAMPSRLFWKKNLRETTPRFDSLQTETSRNRIEQFKGIILTGHDRPFDTQSGEYVQDRVIEL
ncbi:MAG TPA: MBL fold metallo-hydrolase [bacterium]|nr:MBL fold metallo-hydrolase [bacterium]